MKIRYVSFQFYVRVHNNIIWKSEWATFCWYLKRLKLFATESEKDATTTATNRQNIHKINCVQIRSTITILSSCWTEFQQGTSGKKNWSKTTDESRQYRQVFTAKYTHSVRCSSCLQEIVFCGYVTVIQYISVWCVCVYVYDLHGFRSKQTILFYAFGLNSMLLLLFVFFSVVVLR